MVRRCRRSSTRSEKDFVWSQKGRAREILSLQPNIEEEDEGAGPGGAGLGPGGALQGC